MQNKVVFDDTEGSGWVVARTVADNAISNEGTIYASHVACTLTPPKPNYSGDDNDDGERWSWFVDDIPDREQIHICFECHAPVPEHIQALVVLHTLTEEV